MHITVYISVYIILYYIYKSTQFLKQDTAHKKKKVKEKLTSTKKNIMVYIVFFIYTLKREIRLCHLHVHTIIS